MERHGIIANYVFICVSNFGKLKNQEELINNFYYADVPNSVLILIGSKFNEYSEFLKTLIEDDRVYLFEKLSRNEIISALFSADLFLFTSLVEVFPIVIIEAMASSLPFLSNKVGAIEEFIGGKVVIDKDRFIDELKEFPNRIEEWKLLGEKGRRSVVEKYNWDEIIKKYDEVIKNVC